MTNRVADKSEIFDAKLLEGAFERFNQASLKLESRYESLRKEAEELRRQLKLKEEEIKRNQKLATLGETAAALAHEVRNPLGAIKLFISLLKEELLEKPKALEIIAHVERSVENLDSVVTNILQFAQDSCLMMSPMNLHALIEAELASMRLLCRGREIGFSRMLSANPFIIGNEESLRQGIHNLLLNATQVLRNRGEISVTTADSKDSAGREGVLLQISDNGPGIPRELLDKIFDPFVTGRKEGTGLGLAIVRKIVLKHAGQISATNDRGAKFTIFLPRKAVLERSDEGLQ